MKNEDRLEDRDTAVVLEERLEVAGRLAEDLGDEIHRELRVAAPAAVDQQVVARDVLDQEPAVAVVDQPAGGLDGELPEPVVLGELPVIVPLDDLHEPEPGADEDEDRSDQPGHHPHPDNEILAMLTNDFHRRVNPA